MKTSEAALTCRVTAETILAWAKAGRLRAARTPGGHYRFDPAEVHALMSADLLSGSSAEASV
ncbi:excisionase family DNA-binding protein [Nonomuraea wenchangensis]